MNEAAKVATVIHWPDLGYAAIVTPGGEDGDPHYVEFQVYELVLSHEDPAAPTVLGYGPNYEEMTATPEGAPVFLDGSIEWDGCSNWDLEPDSDMLLHFCGKAEAVGIGALFGRLYDAAAEAMPGWREDVLS